MDDEELSRARRALRGVDPELDLSRVYAESWARAGGTDTQRAETQRTETPRTETPRTDAYPTGSHPAVEILLRDPGSGTRHDPPVVRRGRTLFWAAAAAAAAVALVVGVANLPAPRTVPGGVPAASSSPHTAPGSAPGPLPSFGSTPAQVVLQVAKAVAATSCDVETRSTLGGTSNVRIDDTRARDTATPQPIPLDQEPLEVLQSVATDLALGLSAGADHGLRDGVVLEELGGETMVRIRFTPPPGLVPSGVVTRVDLLVDPSTWLPRAEKTWATSDSGAEYLLESEFFWTACGEPGSSTSDDGDQQGEGG